jgi:hypothetical protein
MFVPSRLGSTTTADLPETADVVQVTPNRDLPLEPNQWSVRGDFVERAGSDPPRRAHFTCDISVDGETARVLV